MGLEARGFRAITGAVSTSAPTCSWGTVLGVSPMAIGGVAVVRWHGTRSGGFSRSAKSPTYFSSRKIDAAPYATRGVLAAQRAPKGYRGQGPEILEVAVEPGRILDLNTSEGERDFRIAMTAMYQGADREDRPSVKGILASSESYRGNMRARAIPYWLLDAGLGRFLKELGYDSAYASEGHFQSLAIFGPKSARRSSRRERSLR
jgi:hypothetical protein